MIGVRWGQTDGSSERLAWRYVIMERLSGRDMFVGEW